MKTNDHGGRPPKRRGLPREGEEKQARLQPKRGAAQRRPAAVLNRKQQRPGHYPSRPSEERRTEMPQPAITSRAIEANGTESELSVWQQRFLEEFSRGATIGMAARSAGVPVFQVLGARRIDPAFAAAWTTAEEALRERHR